MKFLNVKKENIYIDGIPVIVLKPELEMDNYPTVVFYHGWSSKKEYQEFRGSILAGLGYQVIIPDAIHHGERGTLDYDESENSGFFWEVVLNNLKEWRQIRNYATEELDADPERIAVTGHSMGGFTAAGIFAENPEIRTSVILNGSFNWLGSNEEFKRRLNVHMTKEFKNLEQEVQSKNPAGKIDFLVDRPILILHGEADSMVEITPQRDFYEKLKHLYKVDENIKMISYKNLDHFVTTNMLEEMGKWFSEKLMEV
ncbi:alpha/beta fold hydrolase [Gudongella sp. DL1XJH-153]|uniref:alpha/beta fold hydrolase n=1 Tax=Gudongella sp. DL1XJH-153 TaxID=3409804 RepID=UPI003BB73321